MSLERLQAALARLYTDRQALERYLEDPPGWARDNDLQELAAVDPAQVRFFANSLVSKRAGAVRHLLPQASKALGAEFVPLFREFAPGAPLQGVKKHRNDAVAFAAWLGRRMPGDWRADLAQLEAARLRMSERGRRVSVYLRRQSATLWLRLGRRVKEVVLW